MTSDASKMARGEQSPEISGMAALALLAMVLGLLLCYYGPCLLGYADFYYADLTFFFEPFCHFVKDEIRHGNFPLWNQFLYSGMSQLAVPSPGLFYIPSWLVFMLPFSRGLACYMIFHQLLAGAGAFLYFRERGVSRVAAIFGGAATCLCAYMFALIRNFTLPATVAWLPLALYFENRISSQKSHAPVKHILGLALSVSMIIYAGRPEVGAPALVLIALACFSRTASAILSPHQFKIERSTLYKLLALILGVALALPTIIPALEWSKLSPRSGGLPSYWVFAWSANWYDFLGMILSQPLGNLDQMSEKASQFGRLVISPGPTAATYLSSAYIAPVVISLSIWGLTDRQYKHKWVMLALLLAFIILAAGNFTPLAPAIIQLSPYLSMFRYPVKLLIFPCLILILLAVHGMEHILAGRLSKIAVAATGAFWFLAICLGSLIVLFPQFASYANNCPWLFHTHITASILWEAEKLVANSMILAGSTGLATCVMTWLTCQKKLAKNACALLLTILSSLVLFASSICNRQISPPGFYEQSSSLAKSLDKRRKSQWSDSTSLLPAHDASDSIIGLSATRILNLYGDALTMTADYRWRKDSSIIEDYVQYSRELLAFQTLLCSRIPGSFGYEGAETAIYRKFFQRAFALCSQSERRPPEKQMSDAEMQNFAVLTATGFVNTQVSRNGESADLPLLDQRFFELLEENNKLNFRIYRVKNARPRLYFTNNLNIVESFDKQTDSRSTPVHKSGGSGPLSFISKDDYEKNKKQFEAMISNAGSPPADLPAVDNRSDNPHSNDKNVLTILRDSGQTMIISSVCSKPMLLVVADQYFPGWIAEIDGTSTEILKANFFNRAVVMPAGRHELRMSYRPFSLLLGISCSFFSIIVFALVSLFSQRNRQKNNPDSAASLWDNNN